jgi:hypothetical protein
VRYPEVVIQNFGIVMTPGRFMVDFVLWRRWHIHRCAPLPHSIPVKYVPVWFPGAGFQRFAKEHVAIQRQALDGPIAAVKTQMVRRRRPFSSINLTDPTRPTGPRRRRSPGRC